MGSAEINIPTGCTIKDIVAWGTSGLVFLDSSSNTAIKVPHPNEDALINIRIEKQIYERFTHRGRHDGLLRYLGPCETGIRLEFASKQGILPHLERHKSDIDLQQRLQWCQEISGALAFIHSNKCIHGDLKCNNIFLDYALHAKVADFSGSALDGKDLRSIVTASHRSPRDLNSTEGDIYALGSTIYEIMTGQAPYAGLKEQEILDMFSKSIFPETTGLGPMGHIIQSCWKGELKRADDVWTSIRDIEKRSTSLHESPYPSKLTATVVVISAICLLAVYWKRATTGR